MFFGTQKFREFIHDHFPMVEGNVTICFIPKESFNVQFNHIAVKPIAIIAVSCDGNEEVAVHRELLQECHGTQPFVCVNPAYAMIDNNKRLQALTLLEPVKSFSGYSFSPICTYNLDEKKIDNILQSKVTEEKDREINKIISR